MTWFQTEEEFWAAFESINAVMLHKWEPTNAKKDHTDAFGAPINSGQTYFKQSYGVAWDQMFRVSRASMETILFALLHRNPRLQQICDEWRKEELLRLHDVMDFRAPSKEPDEPET